MYQETKFEEKKNEKKKKSSCFNFFILFIFVMDNNNKKKNKQSIEIKKKNQIELINLISIIKKNGSKI